MKTVIIYPVDKQNVVDENDYDQYIMSQLVSDEDKLPDSDREYLIDINSESVKFIFDYDLSTLDSEIPKPEDAIGLIPIIETKPDGFADRAYRKLLIYSQIRRVIGMIASLAMSYHEIPVYLLCLFHKDSDLYNQAPNLPFPTQNSGLKMAFCYMDEIREKVIQLIEEE